jgi:hypothetical protein
LFQFDPAISGSEIGTCVHLYINPGGDESYSTLKKLQLSSAVGELTVEMLFPDG